MYYFLYCAPLHTNSFNLALSFFLCLSPSPILPLSLFPIFKPLSHDTSVSDSIVSDLFPGVFLLASHCSIQDVSNREIIRKMNLKVRFWFIKEIIRIRKCLI